MRLKLSLLLVFIITFSWSQTTKTFTTNGILAIPAGVASINAQAWGGGGSGGGASGSGILLGRGAAGGGGGAYVSATLSVASGQVINVEVAGQTPGTSGSNGTHGGFSTITGFESSFLAAGGSGGGANNDGGTPLGGNGGSVSSSAGTVKLAGFNGVQGNTWSLLSLLLTSGAGGAGANLGGAGGAAVGSLILGNAPGNAGSAPGGGGSGAINSALGTAQVGGAGGAGRVIISYTCPTYNITGATASNVCISGGSNESFVTVASSAAALPAGGYTVTYNRSNPNATGLTANMTVTTTGTGTFTATGFTAVGNSIIQITNITSQSCSSNITSNNTATVIISPATVGGVVSGGTTINTGNTSGLLTLSGHTGSVVKWQSSVSPFTTWVDIVNTNATYTSGVLNETTQFRAVVKSGTCMGVNSEPTTVIVTTIPSIQLAEFASDVCSDGSATTTSLSYKGTTGNPFSYSIVWNSSPVNSFAAVTDAALPASPITINVPEETAEGTYTGTLTVKNAGGNSIGKTFEVTVRKTPYISTTGTITPITASTNSQFASLFYSGTSGSLFLYSIDWDSAANAALLTDQVESASYFQTEGGSLDTIVIPANVPAGIYNGTLYLSNLTGTCTSSQSVLILINEPEPPTIELADYAENVCYNGSATTTSLSYQGTTGDPVTYSIVWNVYTETGYLEDVTDAVLPSSPITINIPAGIPADTYVGKLKVKNTNGDVSASYTFRVVVNQTFDITTEEYASQVFQSTNDQNTRISYYLEPGTLSPTSYYIDWNPTANQALLADQPDTSFFFDPNAALPEINTIYVPANLSPGVYSGTLYVTDGICVVSNEIGLNVLAASAFSKSIAATPEIENFAKNAILVTTLNKVINVSSSDQNINKVFVYDTSGNLIYKKNTVGDSKLVIDNLGASNQILIVKVILDDNSIKTKKVIH